MNSQAPITLVSQVRSIAEIVGMPAAVGEYGTFIRDHRAHALTLRTVTFLLSRTQVAQCTAPLHAPYTFFFRCRCVH